jgi:predicted  nucleic acid-binding Zn-ribbon protein
MSAFDDLLEVQQLDTTADQLRHRMSTLPERDRVAAAIAALGEIAIAVADADSRRGDVRREQRRHEDEVATTEAKAEQVNGQLYGGTITSPKELEALQHELDGLHARQRDLEDLVIEQMELAEPIDEELASLAARAESTELERTAAQAELDAALAAIEVELTEVSASRERLAKDIPDDLLAGYESIRSRSGGIGAAHLSGNRCEGCHLAIPSADLDAIRHAPADAMVTCPECGRILVR